MDFIDLKKQYQLNKKNIDSRIRKVLTHGSYIMGPEVEELEHKLAKYVGVKHAITCANGTDALSLALKALDISYGDAVFCPSFTFFATAESIKLSGAEPIFVDSEIATFNICHKDLEKKIIEVIEKNNHKPKAIMPVDLFGLPANYIEIEKIAKKYDLKIIEDAAQGFGGSINNKKAGSFGDIATTSFFPAKPLGCYGDGGAVFTNNDEYADSVRSLRVHGKGIDKYDNIRIGFNSRLDSIQAAILLEKLEIFPQELELRNKIAAKYTELLSDKFKTPIVPSGFYSSWAQYSLLSNNRDSAISKFKKRNIPTNIYYKKCIHQQKAFDYLGHKDDEFPNASRLSKEVFSIPMHPYLDIEELNEAF